MALATGLSKSKSEQCAIFIGTSHGDLIVMQDRFDPGRHRLTSLISKLAMICSLGGRRCPEDTYTEQRPLSRSLGLSTDRSHIVEADLAIDLATITTVRVFCDKFSGNFGKWTTVDCMILSLSILGADRRHLALGVDERCVTA